MIIREIKLKNFLTLYGEQTIRFPEGKGHTTTLILGPNNSGKSSFVKALQFLLHQRLPGCTEETSWLLINNRHREEAGEKEEVRASVTGTFAFGGKELTIRRMVRARRFGKADESFKDAEITFSHLSMTQTGSRFVLDEDQSIQRRIDVQCPDTLLEAFFFSGEPLDGKLLKGVQQVKESLEEYLSIRQWRDAASAARALRLQYEQEKQRLAAKNRELENSLREEAEFQARLDVKRQAKGELEASELRLKEELEARQSAILAIANQAQMRQDVTERERLSRELKKHEQTLEAADAEICGVVGRSAGHPFLLRFVPKAQQVLERLHKENVLPAELSPDFVERVVQAEACLCGRDHTKATRMAWQAYLAKALERQVGTKLLTLEGRLNPNAPNSLPRNVVEMGAQIREARNRREASLVATFSLEGRIETLSQRIAESPEEELRRLERERTKLAAQVKEAEGRRTQVEGEIKTLQNAKDRKREERKKISVSPDMARRVLELERHQVTADALADLIDRAIEALRRQFHTRLQEEMREMYDASVTDGTTALVSGNSLLPSIMQNGRRVVNLGGGQSQLLGLAYITAIARLRNALHAEMSDLKITLGLVGEQAFVLDCPFSGMEGHLIEAAVKGLRAAASQSVFLLHGSQWQVARPMLEPHTTAAWGVHLHAPAEVADRLSPEDHTYEYAGKKVQLVTVNRTAQEAIYSELKPLTEE